MIVVRLPPKTCYSHSQNRAPWRMGSRRAHKKADPPMAERMERLRHLVPVGTSITERYTNPQKGGSGFRSPHRNRHQHGTYLRDQLDLMRSRAVALGQERLAFGLEADEGIYIEFVGEIGFDLAVGSLEDARHGLELSTR